MTTESRRVPRHAGFVQPDLETAIGHPGDLVEAAAVAAAESYTVATGTGWIVHLA